MLVAPKFSCIARCKRKVNYQIVSQDRKSRDLDPRVLSCPPWHQIQLALGVADEWRRTPRNLVTAVSIHVVTSRPQRKRPWEFLSLIDWYTVRVACCLCERYWGYSHYNVKATSRRRFDVIITLLFYRVLAGMRLLGISIVFRGHWQCLSHPHARVV